MKKITVAEMQGYAKQDFQDWLQEIDDEKNLMHSKSALKKQED